LFDDHTQTASALANLSILQLSRGRLAESETSIRESIAMRLRLKLGGIGLGNDYNSLGKLLIEQGQFSEAETEIRKALALNTEATGPGSFRTGASQLNLSRALIAQGQIEAALYRAKTGHQIFVEVFGDEAPMAAAALAYVGDAQVKMGRSAEGMTKLERALSSLRPHGAPVAWYTAASARWLGDAYARSGDRATAQELYREAIQALQEKNLHDSHKIAELQSELASCLIDQQEWSEADRLLRSSVDKLSAALDQDDPRTQLALARLDSLNQIRPR
jgi:tetratricopeptide (TPR) repeat protein